jgi:hypothetical protein
MADQPASCHHTGPTKTTEPKLVMSASDSAQIEQSAEHYAVTFIAAV